MAKKDQSVSLPKLNVPLVKPVSAKLQPINFPRLQSKPKEVLSPMEKLEKQRAVQDLKSKTAIGKTLDTKPRAGLSNVLKGSDVKSPWNAPWWQLPFTLLMRPLQSVLHFIDSARKGLNPITGMFEGLIGLKKDLEPLDAVGIDTKNWSGASKFIGNLFGSIVLDPLTWLTLGGAALARAGGGKALGAVAGAVHNLSRKGVQLSAKSAETIVKYGLTKNILKKLPTITSKSTLKQVTDAIVKSKAPIFKNFKPTVYRVGKTLQGLEFKYVKTVTAPLWAPFKYGAKGIKYVGRNASRVEGLSSGVSWVLRKLGQGVEMVEQTGRNIKAKVQFGYKAKPSLKESLVSLRGENEILGNSVIRSAEEVTKLSGARSGLYWNALNNQELPKKLLDMFPNMTADDFIKETKLFAKQSKIDPKITFDDLHSMLDQQLTVKQAQVTYNSQNAFHITKTFNSQGGMLVANNKQGQAIANWMNYGSASPLKGTNYRVQVQKITNIADKVEYVKNLKRPLTDEEWLKIYKETKKTQRNGRFLNLVDKTTGKSLHRNSKTLELLTSLFERYELNVINGKETLGLDVEFTKMLQATQYGRRAVKKLGGEYQKLTMKYLDENLSKVVRSDDFRTYINDDLFGKFEEFQNFYFSPDVKATQNLVDNIKVWKNEMDDTIVRLIHDKTVDSKIFTEWGWKVNQFYNDHVRQLAIKGIFRDIDPKLQDKAWHYLTTFLDSDEIYRAFDNIKIRKKLIKKLKALRVDGHAKNATEIMFTKQALRDAPSLSKSNFIKKVRAGKALTEQLIKKFEQQLKMVYKGQSIMKESLKKGVAPEDLGELVTDMFIKELKGKLTKNQVSAALLSLKDKLPDDVYKVLKSNISNTNKVIINEKVKAFVDIEQEINRTALNVANQGLNQKYIDAFRLELPVKSFNGIPFRDLKNYKSLTALMDYRYQKFTETLDYIGLSTGVPDYYYKAGYNPLHVNDAENTVLAGLNNIATKHGLDTSVSNSWLPNLSERELSKISDKTYITMRRQYLDNAAYLNSVLGVRLYNEKSGLLLSQVYKNIQDLYFKPSIGTLAFEGNFIRHLSAAELVAYKVGDVLPDGYKVLDSKAAAKILDPMVESLQNSKGITIAKWRATQKEGSELFSNLRENYNYLQMHLEDLKINSLTKDSNVQDALKYVRDNNLLHNRTTQKVNEVLKTIQDDREVMKKLHQDGWWIDEIEFEKYSADNITDFQKEILQLKQDKVLVHNSVVDVLETTAFQEKNLDRTFQHVLRGIALITGVWKGAVLWSNFFGYHGRNILGNFTNAVVGGVNPVYYVRKYGANFLRMQKYHKTTKKIFSIDNTISMLNVTSDKALYRKLAAHIPKKDLDDWFRIAYMKRTGVLGNSRLKEETYALYQASGKYLKKNVKIGGYATNKQKLINTFGRIWNSNVELNMYMDDVHRLTIHSFFEDNPNKWRSLGYQSVDDATRFIGFDFHQLTSFEKKWGQRFFPFYTWFRKNFEFHLKNFGKNTARYRAVLRLLEGWNRDLGDIKDDDMLKWQKDRNYLVDPTSKNRLLKVEVPFFNYNEIMGLQILGKINPFMRSIIEMTTGKSFFYDRAIDDNELTAYLTDSLFQLSTHKKRWMERQKLLTGATDAQLDKMVALAPSFFGKLDREQNRLRNKYEEVKYVEELLQNLRKSGTYVPSSPELKSAYPKIPPHLR